MEAGKEQLAAYLEEAYKNRISDLPQSIKVADEVLSESRKLNDKKLIAQSLSHLSLFYMISGEHQKSLASSEEAIPLFKELKDEKGLADINYNLAGVYYKTDNFHMGLAYLIDCRSIYKQHHDNFNLARTEKSLGTIYEYIGDEKNAITSYENSIDAAVKAGDVNLESNVYNPLSGIYLKKGQGDKALELIQRSVEMKSRGNDVRGLAFALYGRGKVYTSMGKYSEAEHDFEEALKIHLENGEKLGTAMAYRKMGALYEAMNKLDKALQSYTKAYEYSQEHHIAIIKIKAAYHLYQLFKKQGDLGKALTFLEEYICQREAVINTQTLKVIENYELKSQKEMLEREAQLQREKAEIIEKKNLAEQASRVRQEFLSTMSHEIRTPLNAVTTISSLLKDRADSEEQELLNSLRFASANLLQIINDILDFTKLESGTSKLELRPVSLKKLAQNIYGTYSALAVDKGLQLQLHLDDALADAYEMDETKFTQIMANLVSNAVKYTERGKVDIYISHNGTDKEYDTISFSVKDTGTGISPENLKRIFEEFFQPEAVTTRKEKGTGLGLAIVKKLVELHGSRIHAQSTQNEGSEFYFDLKLKRSVVNKQSAVRNRDKLKGKLILLAEDNMVNALVATRLLSNWGAETEHVHNGVLAVKKAEERKYDFILMDLHMPDMNGYDATKAIRSNDNMNANTLIYALTADITADQQEEYTGLFNGFLRKPIEIDTMYDVLTG